LIPARRGVLARAIFLFTLATTRSAWSGSGRCSSRALGASANNHKSTSAGVVRVTGIAFGWIGATTAFGSVVRKPKTSCCPSTGALFGPRTPRQGVHRPANANNGRSWLSANHFGVFAASYPSISKTRSAGTMQRLCLPSHPCTPDKVRWRKSFSTSLGLEPLLSGRRPLLSGDLAPQIWT
jgi:hypothetical protein